MRFMRVVLPLRDAGKKGGVLMQWRSRSCLNLVVAYLSGP